MSHVLRKLMLFLQSIIGVLEKNKPSENKTNSAINNLAPKILTDSEDLEKIKPYLNNLKQAIETKGINNIAITGSYGSGKSTILKTFQDQYQEYRYLSISLASFKETAHNKNTAHRKSNLDFHDESFERRLEISILQQMFYHVKPSVIPDSRFKRIINVSGLKLTGQASLAILWLLSSLILFMFGYVEKLNPENWNLKYQFDWIGVISSAVFFFGFGVIVGKIFRLFRNSRINKLSIKGELELGESVDKSVFNKHLEEILYFFERTPFNVVIIEDVDRFDSTDIFTKLREINILLNNSEPIERPIKFLYAIRDGMFKDKNERVKFFEFIIPVIPFINPSNAGDQLSKLIVKANLQEPLTEDFISDIVTFIDDIDMRLLINIFQEYQVYRSILNVSLKQDNLFAILIYKNLYPDDFDKLDKRGGNLFRFLTEKGRYIEGLRNNIQNEIKLIDQQLSLLEEEIDRPIRELRAVYINKIISHLDQFHKLELNGVEISLDEALDDEYFEVLKENNRISYFQYSHDYYRNLFKIKTSNIYLSDVEIEVSDKLTYQQREDLLKNKSNDGINTLKREKEKLKQRIFEIESLSIKEIFEQVEIDEYLNEFENSYLMRNLLLNGYINENFEDYISLFHEVSLTKGDFLFERNVKSGVLQDFNYQLTKVENVIKRLPDKYFQRDTILNYSLLECLLDNHSKYQIKLSYILNNLKKEGQRQFDFIHGFISTQSDRKGQFVNYICKSKTNFWFYLNTKSGLSESEVKNYLRLIFEYAEWEDINNLDSLKSLIKLFEGLENPFIFLLSIENTSNIRKFISTNVICFTQLDLPSKAQSELFEFIYSNNHYMINENNIRTIVTKMAPEVNWDRFDRSNYTTLLELNLKPLNEYLDSNIEVYISNVMTFMEENKEEAESVILDILNRMSDEVKNRLKERVLLSQNIKIGSINNIQDLKVKQLTLSHNKIAPNWQNVFDYGHEVGNKEDAFVFDELLIDFLNNQSNYEVLSKIKLDTIDATSEDIKSISNRLLHCHELNDDSYFQLLDSLPYRYRSINYKEFNESRINILLDKRLLTLTSENLEGLKLISKALSLRLIEDTQENFIRKFEELSLESEDWLGVFKSSQISYQNKLKLFSEMDPSIITDSKSLANVICDLMPDDKHIPVSFDLLSAMFEANYSIAKRVSILNLNLPYLTNDQIKELIKKLRGEYPRVFKKQHKPKFPNYSFNVNLFNGLVTRDLIIRYEPTSGGKELKVIAKYQ